MKEWIEKDKESKIEGYFSKNLQFFENRQESCQKKE